MSDNMETSNVNNGESSAPVDGGEAKSKKAGKPLSPQVRARRAMDRIAELTDELFKICEELPGHKQSGVEALRMSANIGRFDKVFDGEEKIAAIDRALAQKSQIVAELQQLNTDAEAADKS